MLQWTREGQETLQVARRQHNGGLECFRKRDYAASKRFLQNALRLRKTVLSHSHPIILGNIEMLSIVSELAQNAQHAGCSVQTNLFLTAEDHPAVDKEADDRVLATGIGTVAQLARLKLRDDPAINDRFDPASPSFTLFRTIDGETIDPCLVEHRVNQEELKMILWELFYLQQLRLGPYHVDTQLTLTRLWEIATEQNDSVTAEALNKKIWEMRVTPPSQRRAVAMDVALGHPAGLTEDPTSDSVQAPLAHPSTLLFAAAPKKAEAEVTRGTDFASLYQTQKDTYSDFDFALSNLERKVVTTRKGAPGSSTAAGGSSGAGNGTSALSNFYSVQPKAQRRIPMLADNSWEAELRKVLGVDKTVEELMGLPKKSATTNPSAANANNDGGKENSSSGNTLGAKPGGGRGGIAYANSSMGGSFDSMPFSTGTGTLVSSSPSMSRNYLGGTTNSYGGGGGGGGYGGSMPNGQW